MSDMLPFLPFLKDLDIPITSYEIHVDVATVRINALLQEVFVSLTQSTGPSNANADRWYLSAVNCGLRPSSWSTDGELLCQSAPRSIEVAGRRLVEDVVLTFRQLPKTVFTAEEVCEEMRKAFGLDK